LHSPGITRRSRGGRLSRTGSPLSKLEPPRMAFISHPAAGRRSGSRAWASTASRPYSSSRLRLEEAQDFSGFRQSARARRPRPGTYRPRSRKSGGTRKRSAPTDQRVLPILGISAATTGRMFGAKLAVSTIASRQFWSSEVPRRGCRSLLGSISWESTRWWSRNGLASETAGGSGTTRWLCTIQHTSIISRTWNFRPPSRPTFPRTCSGTGSRSTRKPWRSTAGRIRNSSMARGTKRPNSGLRECGRRTVPNGY
jgi:hypothetical protein